MDEGSRGKYEKGHETRMKILEVAQQVFAEKGYDGARTEEIAKRAGVNKALIYYYFENKETLLKAMIDSCKADVCELKKSLMQGINDFDEENMTTYFLGIFDFMEKRRDILRIISIEALKASSKDTSIFNMLLPTYEEITEKFRKLGRNLDKQDARMLHSFFFNVTPMVVFFTLGEKWADYYEMTYEEAKMNFLDIYKHQFVTFFRDRYK